MHSERTKKGISKAPSLYRAADASEDTCLFARRILRMEGNLFSPVVHESKRNTAVLKRHW